jgi:CRP-like cAMP-binding protein
MEQYMKVLKSYKGMPPAMESFLQENIRAVVIKRNEIIQPQDPVFDHIYFIEKGIVRAFGYKRQQQLTYLFKKEIIEAIEDSVLWAFPGALIEQALDRFPEFNEHLRLMIMKEEGLMYRQFRLEHGGSLSDKYDYIRQTFPDFLKRIPPKYLASFRGISEKQFSRIHETNLHMKIPVTRRRRPKSL